MALIMPLESVRKLESLISFVVFFPLASIVKRAIAELLGVTVSKFSLGIELDE